MRVVYAQSVFTNVSLKWTNAFFEPRIPVGVNRHVAFPTRDSASHDLLPRSLVVLQNHIQQMREAVSHLAR